MKMSEIPDSFQVILSSNESLDVFPQNTSSSFCNVLPQNIKIDGYDIALANIYFKDQYRKPWTDDDNTFPPLHKQNTPFFDELFGENEITVVSEISSHMLLTKEHDELSAFITTLNEKCVQMRWNVQFAMKLAQGDLENIIMRFVDPDNSDLDIGTRLARVLGFENTKFKPGAYKSQRKPNVDAFNELRRSSFFDLVKTRWERKVLKVPQIFDPSLEDITLKIHETLARNQLSHITLDVDEETATLIIDTGSDSQILKLSSRLNSYLGLKPDKTFKNLEYISVPRQIIDPYRSVQISELINRPIPELSSSSNKIFVTTTVIKSNFVGHNKLPVIATIDRVNGEKEYNYSPHPMIYYESNQPEANIIKVQLLSDKLIPIPPKPTPTVCCLHLKRKRI